MASPVLQVTIPDIYEPTVLRDLSERFVEQSLAGVDTNQEIISKIKLIISRNPFLKETDGAAISCLNYEESTETHEHSWTRPPENESILKAVAAAEGVPAEVVLLVSPLLEQLQEELAQIKAAHAYFINNQKKVVVNDLLEDLENSWAGLREQIEEREKSVQPGSNDFYLAYVEGKIKLQIYTLDKESESLESVEAYETSFEIRAE